MTRILPYQSGGDLVFILVREDQVARWKTPPLPFYGLAPIEFIGPLVTFPNIKLARAARVQLNVAPELVGWEAGRETG